MRIRWLPSALSQLDAEAAYIASDTPTAAASIVERIRAAVNRLSAFPALGRSGRVTGTRELIVAATPYIVVYRIREDVVEILSIMHMARKWPGQF